MSDDLYRLTLHGAGRRPARGQFSSVELTQALLDRIVAVDARVGAYLTVTADLALEQAAAADGRRASGDDGPLLGLPIALKDVLSTAASRPRAPRESWRALFRPTTRPASLV